MKSFYKKIISKITQPIFPRNKWWGLALVMAVAMVGIFLFAKPAQASVLTVVADILMAVASLLGKILVVFINILLGIVQYNDFANAVAVTKGWVIVRDACNMFFVLVLLLIAFGTILKIESYKYNRLLGKLILMVVLINFSKLIAGFFIDLAQVVMMTFVNAFANVAHTNFTDMFHLEDMLNFLNTGTATPSAGELMGVPLLAIFMLIVAIMTMLAMIVVFLVRIIALWILVVLSPLAYLLNVLPMGQRYSGQWWSTFGKWLTTGPILAFFIWLSFTILGNTTASGVNISSGAISQVVNTTGASSLSPGVSAGISAVSTSENILSFILSIAMLFIALVVAQSLGGIAGNFAGKMAGAAKTVGTKPFKWAGAVAGAPIKGAKALGGWGIKKVDDWQAGLQQRLMRSRVGSVISRTKVGKSLGLSKLQEHGIQIRAIPMAWKARKERLEVQRIGEAPAVGEDILNRFYSWGDDKTDYTSTARAGRASKARSDVAAAGTEQEVIVGRLINSYSDKDGHVKRERVAEAEAALEILLSNHDPNEVMKHPFFANIMTQRGNVGGKVSQHDLQNILKHMFGDTPDTLRIAKKMEEKGLSQTDSWIKGITQLKVNKDTGETSIGWTETTGAKDWNQDEGAKISAAYNKKLAGRNFIQQQRRQNYVTERADDNNNLVFRTLNNVGKANLKENAEGFLKAKLEHFQGEFFDTIANNLDLAVEWAEQVREQHERGEAGELTKPELERLESVIGKISAGQLGLEREDALNKSQMLEKELRPDLQALEAGKIDEEEFQRRKVKAEEGVDRDWSRQVLEAVNQRQTDDFWHGVSNVNKRRTELGWDKNETDYNPAEDYEAAETYYIDDAGETHHYNPKLQKLIDRSGTHVLKKQKGKFTAEEINSIKKEHQSKIESSLLSNRDAQANLNEMELATGGVGEALSSSRVLAAKFPELAKNIDQSLSGLVSALQSNTNKFGKDWGATGEKAAHDLLDILNNAQTQSTQAAKDGFGGDKGKQQDFLWQMTQLTKAMRENARRNPEEILKAVKNIKISPGAETDASKTQEKSTLKEEDDSE